MSARAVTLSRVLVLGTGYTGTRVALRARARGLAVLATVRRDEHAFALRQLGVDTVVLPQLDAALASHVDGRTHVVITFPPDGHTDARVAPSLGAAAAVTYVSSTGVYGALRGHIDDATPTPPATGRSAARLEAEALYRQQGATVLRCPGIYGPDRGIHVRLLRGEYRLPGDGTRALSRIHVDDLAELILAAPASPGETFVVGDAEPATHAEIARWLAAVHGLPFPQSVPLDQVHETLRADRAVDGSRALRQLGVQLAYPTYREGMEPSVTRPSP